MRADALSAGRIIRGAQKVRFERFPSLFLVNKSVVNWFGASRARLFWVVLEGENFLPPLYHTRAWLILSRSRVCDFYFEPSTSTLWRCLLLAARERDAFARHVHRLPTKSIILHSKAAPIRAPPLAISLCLAVCSLIFAHELRRSVRLSSRFTAANNCEILQLPLIVV